MLKKFFLIILLLNFGSAVVLAQTVSQAVPVAADKNALLLRRQSFEKVWTTINEKHFDPAFGGVDWKKMRVIYEPKALATKSDDEFHAVLQQMLNELGQSHFRVIPTQAVIETPKTNARGTIGIELKTINEKPVIFRIRENSPAAKANLKPGYIVKKINDRSVNELGILQALLRGAPGTTISLEVLDEKDETRTFNLTRVAETAEYSLPLGNFPPQPIEFETRRLEDGVGYIRFNIWVMPQLAKIRQAISEIKDAPGIIFDLRGNPGGLGILAAGIAGNLVAEQTSLGSLKFRLTEQKFIAYPQADSYKGKIVVLTDGGSASTSEIFAAGLQEIKRAKVVGETTMGAVLASIFDRLPTGAIFQYAISDYKSPGNVLIEGRGVKPNVEAQLTRESLLAGRDSQIDAAVREILK
ncbi:MAG: S41 family peptidase [Acidobacteriota bacterium]|nr:S41 family peptidase [Acidobacteriota bacterium]